MKATWREQKNTTKLAGETLDALFDGRLRLLQSRLGYRASIDALLLAYFVSVQRNDRIVDLGCGNGVIALALARLYSSAACTGLELQAAMVERARRNVRLNGLDERIQIIPGDVRSRRHGPGAGSFDVAVCNPPYRKPSSGRISVNDERRLARHELSGELGDFLGAGAYLLRNKGRLALVYPAVRSADVFFTMRQARIEPKRLRVVHSFDDAAASLVLVEGVKGGKAELVIEKPLTIYRRAKEYTEEVAAMIAGARR